MPSPTLTQVIAKFLKRNLYGTGYCYCSKDCMFFFQNSPLGFAFCLLCFIFFKKNSTGVTYEIIFYRYFQILPLKKSNENGKKGKKIKMFEKDIRKMQQIIVIPWFANSFVQTQFMCFKWSWPLLCFLTSSIHLLVMRQWHVRLML